jgi:hypothetical protein
VYDGNIPNITFNGIYKLSVSGYFLFESQITQAPSIILGHVMIEEVDDVFLYDNLVENPFSLDRGII